MSDISEAFLAGRRRASDQTKEAQPTDAFQRGVEWVEGVLKPAVKHADEALRDHGVAIRFDVNLDRRSTNHPHADFWFVQMGTASGQSYDGPKYSFNVVQRDIMLYKTGAAGRSLGTIGSVGPDELRALLRQAAEEYGALFRTE